MTHKDDTASQPRLQLLRQIVTNLLEKAFVPVEEKFLREGIGAMGPDLEALRGLVRDMKLWTPHLPTELGGLGLSLSEFAVLSEELGRSPFGHYAFNCQAPDIGNMELMIHHADEAQKREFLEPLIRGEIRSTFLMTEPEHAGSNPQWLSTTAVKDGSDYVLNGHKWFASGADGAAFALVMGITDSAAPRNHGKFSLILVPTDTAGFELVRNLSVMGESGAGYFSHSEVRLVDCRVPRKYLLSSEGSGFLLAQERLGIGRVHHCMRWIGICERAFDMTCRRIVDRELAPGRPMAAHPVVQHQIAELRAEINAARLLVLDTARALETDRTRLPRESISLLKFFVANVLQRVLDQAIQLHGALGLCDDLLLSHWYRHERGARIYDGPDEVHKSVAAAHILRRYGYRVEP